MPRAPIVSACVLIIGNEILSGRTQDVNLAHIANAVNEHGVQVREARVIADLEDEIIATLNESRKKFEANPAAYAPAAGGKDVVLLTDDKSDAEGTLDNAVWFKDRLYLFSSKDSLEMFVISPAKYSIQDSKE